MTHARPHHQDLATKICGTCRFCWLYPTPKCYVLPPVESVSFDEYPPCGDPDSAAISITPDVSEYRPACRFWEERKPHHYDSDEDEDENLV